MTDETVKLLPRKATDEMRGAAWAWRSGSFDEIWAAMWDAAPAPAQSGGEAVRLPNIEAVSAAVHIAWMDSKHAQGVTSRKAEDGEELMVPYEALTEKAKQLDRNSVQAVYDAILSIAAQPVATKTTEGK